MLDGKHLTCLPLSKGSSGTEQIMTILKCSEWSQPDKILISGRVKTETVFLLVVAVAGCTRSVGETGAPAWNPWSALILTQTSGACVPPCPRGGVALVWPPTTGSCTPWEATTLLLPTTAPACPTAWRGTKLFCFFSFSLYIPRRDPRTHSLHCCNVVF